MKTWRLRNRLCENTRGIAKSHTTPQRGLAQCGGRPWRYDRRRWVPFRERSNSGTAVFGMEPAPVFL